MHVAPRDIAPFSQSTRCATHTRGSFLVGLVALLLPLAIGASQAHVDRECLDDVPELCLTIEEDRSGVQFSAVNASLAPYTVRIRTRNLENLTPARPGAMQAVLGPGESRPIGKLLRASTNDSYQYELQWAAATGSMLAKHDATWHYRMPFGGDATRRVSQGMGGTFSHQGANRYAIDFEMPFGTPVLAARAGVVIRVQDGADTKRTQTRTLDSANVVEVLHRDGTIATYAHLRNGIAVALGQAVATGDPLGDSGDSGYATGPHLHFMVWKRHADLTTRSLPVRFHDGTQAGFVPSQGIAYAPACTSSGVGCRDDESLPPSERWNAEETVRPAAAMPAARQPDGSCACANGAVIRVEGLRCNHVCGG